jgi:hypothetical protein
MSTETHAGRRRGRLRRRWWRLVVPFAVLGLLVTVTMVARALEEPDLGDPGTLAPAGTGPDGSSRLAELLAQRGVAIEPVDDLDAAEVALRRGGDAVVFVPKPTSPPPGWPAPRPGHPPTIGSCWSPRATSSCWSPGFR